MNIFPYNLRVKKEELNFVVSSNNYLSCAHKEPESIELNYEKHIEIRFDMQHLFYFFFFNEKLIAGWNHESVFIPVGYLVLQGLLMIMLKDAQNEVFNKYTIRIYT